MKLRKIPNFEVQPVAEEPVFRPWTWVLGFRLYIDIHIYVYI